MENQLGNIIRRERQARRLSLRRLAERIKKKDGHSIASQYLNDIELNHRTPSLLILRELARELDQDLDRFLILAGAGTEVVREYLEQHPQTQAEIVQLFRVAIERGFKDWGQLRKTVERSRG